DRDLQVVGPDRDPGQRHEGEVASDQAFLDGAEHRLVGFDVDVDVLELADPHSVAADACLAVPFADVLLIGHAVVSSEASVRVGTGELSSAALRARLPIRAARSGNYEG